MYKNLNCPKKKKSDISGNAILNSCKKVRLYIRTVTADGQISTLYSTQPDIYIVANPYSKNDSCYFDKASYGLFNNFDEFVDEYVLNEGRENHFRLIQSRSINCYAMNRYKKFLNRYGFLQIFVCNTPAR